MAMNILSNHTLMGYPGVGLCFPMESESQSVNHPNLNFGPVIYLAIVNTDFSSSLFFLCSLLFTHFEDTQEAVFLWVLIFWPN